MTSANTVGYQTMKLDAEAGEWMHVSGINFLKTGGSEEDVVTADSTGKFADYQCVEGDQFYVFNSEFFNYDVYTYYEGGIGWLCTPGDGESDEYPMDGFSFGARDSFMVIPGDGESFAFSVSGQVEASGTKEITFDVGEDYTFPFSNPFPIDTKLSDLDFIQEGDQLYVFNPDFFNYDVYTYYEGGVGWLCTPGDGVSDEYPVDGDYVVLKAGQGGMLMPGDTRVWHVTLNYAN